MKLALSTLGCPELALGQAARLAVSHGFHGVEVRSAEGQVTSTAATAAMRSRWRSEMADAGCATLSLATYLRLCDASVPNDDWRRRCTAEVELARDLEATWLRVFPGAGRGAVVDESVDALGRRRLGVLLDVASDVGVPVAVETHDSHPRVRDVLRLLDDPSCRDARIVWDVLHTWLAGESAAESALQLGGLLAYVQIKDVVARDEPFPLPPGHGILPLPDVADELSQLEYDGWVSWEYERTWYPEAAPVAELAPDVRRWCTEHLPV